MRELLEDAGHGALMFSRCAAFSFVAVLTAALRIRVAVIESDLLRFTGLRACPGSESDFELSFISLSEADLRELVERAHGLSGAEISESCRLATLNALRDAHFEESDLAVRIHHIRDAIDTIRKAKERIA